MTDRQHDDLVRMGLRIAAACVAIVVWGISVWILEQITGTSNDTAIRIGLLFLAIFGGSAVVRSIGDVVLGQRPRGKDDR